MRGPRDQLVQLMRATGVLGDPAIARAFQVVPRHRFVPEVAADQAYADRVVPTKWDESGRPVSSASQPSMVALMLEQLAARPGQRVLEIGSGTGYNAALLAELVGEHGDVTTVDIDPDTVRRARAALESTGYRRVRVRRCDGGYGAEEFAPYDRIIVTAGAADLPPAWWRQLVDGGLLVVPLSLGGCEVSVAFVKQAGSTAAEDRMVGRSVVGCGFMPMRGAFRPSASDVPLADSGIHVVVDDPRTVDEAALAAAFETDPVQRTVGVSPMVGELLHGLDPWLASTEPAFARVGLDPEVRTTVRLPTPLRFPVGGGRCSALVESDGVAVLSYARRPCTRDGSAEPDGAGSESTNGGESDTGCSIDGPDVRVDLRVLGYGRRAVDLSDRLTDRVREWHQHGAVGPERMGIVAVPADATPQADSLPSDVHRKRRPHCHLLIRWRRAPVDDDQ